MQPTYTLVPKADRLLRTASLDDSISGLRYVSEPRREVFERMGIYTVRDLFLHIPHRYLDFSQVKTIACADVGQIVSICAVVDKIVHKKPRPKFDIVEVSLVDQTGIMKAVFFRQPWIAQQIHENDRLVVSGKVGFAYGYKQMTSPFFESIQDQKDENIRPAILPVHSVSDGLSCAWMRRIISTALLDRDDMCDFLPANLVAKHGLMSFACACRQIHFPATTDAPVKARKRLAYDELLCLNLALLVRRNLAFEKAGVVAHTHALNGEHFNALLSALPFDLSDEQMSAVQEILFDMASDTIMNRMLLGDVGTGKTIIAALACAVCADSSTQAAMMAPTSVLATQYVDKLGPLFEKASIRYALITGATSMQERKAILSRLKAGEIDVVFGTTALLSDDVCFADLSLVIIDEQHRFGVDQRRNLRKKGLQADLLAMSATPIPRSLALSIYGDTAISRIEHKPYASSPIQTKIVTPENLDIVWKKIADALANHQQIYVVCPRIDDESSDNPEADDENAQQLVEQMYAPAKFLHTVTKEYTHMQKLFPSARIAKLSSQLSAEEKNNVMQKFHDGKIDILVSTTVIEVGVDVANASLMLVFDADRFGLATLHQLRGRVGRANIQGSVFLETLAKKDSRARKRLEFLEKTNDGNKLAEYDLQLRHEGDVLGYRQSGGATLNLVDLAKDSDIIEYAHTDALDIAKVDPFLKNPVHTALAHEVYTRFASYFEGDQGL